MYSSSYSIVSVLLACLDGHTPTLENPKDSMHLNLRTFTALSRGQTASSCGTTVGEPMNF